MARAKKKTRRRQQLKTGISDLGGLGSCYSSLLGNEKNGGSFGAINKSVALIVIIGMNYNEH